MECGKLSCAFNILIFMWIDVNYGKQTMVLISPSSCDNCFCLPNGYDEWFFCVQHILITNLIFMLLKKSGGFKKWEHMLYIRKWYCSRNTMPT